MGVRDDTDGGAGGGGIYLEVNSSVGVRDDTVGGRGGGGAL